MSMRRKLLLSYLAFLAAIIVTFAVVGRSRTENLAWSVLEQQSRSMATSVASLAVLPIQMGDKDELRRLADSLSRDDGMHYCIFENGEGNVISACGDLSLSPVRPYRAPAKEVNGYEILRLDGLLDVCAAVTNSGPEGSESISPGSLASPRVLGRVRLGVSTSRLDSQTRSTFFVMLTLLTGIFVAGIVGGLWATYRMLRPVKSLVAATRRIASGRFDLRVTEPGKATEFIELADSFNTMTNSLDRLVCNVQEKGKALEKANEEIRRANVELEKRVAERTDELARTNARLNREIAEKNDFLRMVSHDLGAPLRNILGMVDSITRRWGGELSNQVKDRLARAKRNAVTEMELIGELLELSRIHTRRQSFSEVNVGEIVSDVAGSLGSDLESRSIRFTSDDRWPTIRCEESRLTRVFQNLIDNAAKYMGERKDARIHTGWHEEDHHYVFHVEDNGVGIAPEDRERIFHVFRRGKTAARHIEGRGVGLAAVKAIAETYDGEAWVESKLGEGSTFYFSLAEAEVGRSIRPASGRTG